MLIVKFSSSLVKSLGNIISYKTFPIHKAWHRYFIRQIGMACIISASWELLYYQKLKPCKGGRYPHVPPVEWFIIHHQNQPLSSTFGFLSWTTMYSTCIPLLALIKFSHLQGHLHILLLDRYQNRIEVATSLFSPLLVISSPSCCPHLTFTWTFKYIQIFCNNYSCM